MPVKKVGDALRGLTRVLQFALLRKKLVDYELVETNDVVDTFEANIQPVPSQKLRILAEGERDWKFWSARTAKKLKLDDIVAEPAGLQYRVVDLEDWEEAGFFRYLLAEQPPQGGTPAAYVTGTREPIKVLADILANQLDLGADALALAYEKNLIPKSAGLYASLDYVGPRKCLSNVNEVDPDTGDEVQSASFSQLVQIDLMSYDASARRRVEEAVMALNSIYARQLMEFYGLSISPNVRFVDASSLEPTKRLNRFVGTVTMFTVHRKVVAAPPLFTSFPGALTEGGPLTPFTPAPLENQ